MLILSLSVEYEFSLEVAAGYEFCLEVLEIEPTFTLPFTQFPHAIANAWTLKEGKLADVSLFDDTHIPALTQSEADTESETGDNGIPPQPVLYVGK